MSKLGFKEAARQMVQHAAVYALIAFGAEEALCEMITKNPYLKDYTVETIKQVRNNIVLIGNSGKYHVVGTLRNLHNRISPPTV